jgi:heptosyltransferase I
VNPPRILVVRLGSMGDVIAALPAVASLKHSIPHSKITWVIDPRWAQLLEGNPFIDSVLHLDRRTVTGLGHAWRELRAARFDIAVDFQGLLKSALVATLARPERIFGFNAAYARESAASWFYSTKVPIRWSGIWIWRQPRAHPTSCEHFRCRPVPRNPNYPQTISC